MINLFAQLGLDNLNPAAIWFLLLALAVALVFVTLVILLVKRYRRCPSNRILVIYGRAGAGRR